MVCEWFTWNYECDLPNWLTLVIEVMIGAGIAVYFFVHHMKERRKKRRWALRRITEIYNSVDDQIGVLEEIHKEYKERNPKGRNDQTDIRWLKKEIEMPRRDVLVWASELDGAVNLHSSDLDQGIKEITKFLIFQIKRLKDPLSLNVIDDIVECNKFYHKKLASIKPNPIKDFQVSQDLMIGCMEGGQLSWKDHLDHLYHGKLNKKK